MEAKLLEFVDLLRCNGVRVSTAETVDAMRCAAIPEILRDRGRLYTALSATMVTRPEQVETFATLFVLFFGQNRPSLGRDAADNTDTAVGDGRLLDSTGGEPGAAGEDMLDGPEELDGVANAPASSPAGAQQDDLTAAFDEDSLHEGVGLDDDDTAVGNIATAGSTIGLEAGVGTGGGPRIQIDVDSAEGAQPGALTASTGTAMDLRLSGEERSALLDWLRNPGGNAPASDEQWDPEEIEALLRRLPDSLAGHLRELVEARITSGPRDEIAPAHIDEDAERERALLEDSLRRLAKSLRGGPTQRTRISPRGRIHPALTTRRSLRFDGIPFDPVSVRRRDDKAKVIVLADVSLSVRATARFTLRLVHSMQGAFDSVRTLVFVDTLAEVTDLFATHPIEHALGLVFGGRVIDTEGNSDYGSVFRQLLREGERLDRRTSIVVLGDGRSNGKDPAIEEFAEIARRVRRIVWLTPEPSYSWGLGTCALPEYAEHCERVDVVRDLQGLERTAERVAIP